MSDRLATYLDNHLAGSRAGLTLLGHIESEFKGMPAGALAGELKAEIGDDREELEALIERIGSAESRPREAVAWVGEKASELKMYADDRRGGPLHRLEALEAMSLGIEGKRLMWAALSAIAEARPDLAGTDFAALERRAANQRERVEALRQQAAGEAFAAGVGE